MRNKLGANDTRLPVTLLTGFLGAGKTTLLNAIIAQSTGPKIAVIVNDFGEVGLDHDLIDTVDEEVALMKSGCLCCSIREDLARVLQSLTARKQENLLTFDRVVIETTGLADPTPILHTFLVDPYLVRNFRIDGVVAVVDAATGSDTLDRQFEAVSQVAMADLLVLSKVDLVSKNMSGAIEIRLRTLNPTANILQVDHGVLPHASLWDLSGMRPQVTSEQAMAWLKPAAPELVFSDSLNNLSGFAPSSAPTALLPKHDPRIGSATIVLEDPIPPDAFDRWLDTLISLRGPNILRVKGIVHLVDIEIPFVFHGVQHLFDPPVPLHDWLGSTRQSRIVVIGRDITRSELVYSFEMLSTRKTPELCEALSE